ncbi:MAG: ribonuclease P protein component 4 [Candidatus Aenigmatarchaeota archaeon]
MKPKWQRKIARERMEILFEEAEKAFPEHQERSDRYVELARKIGMRYKVKIPKEYKRRFCSNCYSYLKPGVNCKVRVNSEEKTVRWECEECGNLHRYPYRDDK